MLKKITKSLRVFSVFVISFLLCFSSVFAFDLVESESLTSGSGLRGVDGDVSQIRILVNSIDGRLATIVNNFNTYIPSIRNFLMFIDKKIPDFPELFINYFYGIKNTLTSYGPNTIASDLRLLKTNNYALLDDLRFALCQRDYEAGFWSSWAVKNCHLLLPQPDTSIYALFSQGLSGNYDIHFVDWRSGSPIGNIALMLYRLQANCAISFSDIYKNLLTNGSHTVLSDTLMPTEFSPAVGFHGTNQFLAGIQNYLVRLNYVLSDDNAIAAHDAAQQNSTAVVDSFVSEGGQGSVSPDKFNSLASVSSRFSSLFSFDVPLSGIFDIFNSTNSDWFSAQTKALLDNSRSREYFATPLLDANVLSVLSVLGGSDD